MRGPARSRARHSVLRAVLSADEGAPLFRSEAQNPHFSREWGEALREPVQAALTLAAREQPEQLARALAPALGKVARLAVNGAVERWTYSVSRWASGLSSPKVWRWALQALWQGEHVWEHAQRKAEWFEVMELGLYDSSSRRCLASAGTVDPKRPLDRFVFPDLAALPGEPKLREAEPVMVLAGSQCRMAARIAGHPPAGLRQQLMGLCFELDSIVGRMGHAGPDVYAVLHRSIRRGLLKEGPFSSAGAPNVLIVAGLALCALFATAFGWLGVKEYQWQGFMTELRAEPGITVLEEDRYWGRRSVSGLRDAQSKDPAKLAAAHGYDANELKLQFKTFLSADAALSTLSTPGSPRPVMTRQPEPLAPSNTVQ
jgi:hypothetical protein